MNNTEIIMAILIAALGIGHIVNSRKADESYRKGFEDGSTGAPYKSNSLYKTIIVLFIIVILAGGYFGGNYIYEQGKMDGYDKGYDLGLEIGYQKCYNEMKEDIEKMAYYEPEQTNDYLTTDNAPEGTVWTTPSGDKYHEEGCRYIDGRYDLTYFNSEEDALNYGYTPCSVCH